MRGWYGGGFWWLGHPTTVGSSGYIYPVLCLAWVSASPAWRVRPPHVAHGRSVRGGTRPYDVGRAAPGLGARHPAPRGSGARPHRGGGGRTGPAGAGGSGRAGQDRSPPDRRPATGHHRQVTTGPWPRPVGSTGSSIHWTAVSRARLPALDPTCGTNVPTIPRTRYRTRPPACGKGRDLGPLTLVNHPGEGFHGRSGARPPADSPRPAGSSAGFPGGLSGGAGTFRRRPTFFPTPATMSEPGTTLSTHHVTRGDGLEKAP